MKVYECDSCGAEITEKTPVSCPLCGRKQFSEYEKKEKKDPEEEKYSKKYENALEELQGYVEGTDPEDYKHSFAD